jgi:DNA adenine methylase
MSKRTAPPEPLRPPLKWAGGKRWLVPHLKPLWLPFAAQNRRLVEPLCGGLAVSLALRPRRALLNDLNPHNVNFYRWLKRGLCLNLEMANEEGLYYTGSGSTPIEAGKRSHKRRAFY